MKILFANTALICSKASYFKRPLSYFNISCPSRPSFGDSFQKSKDDEIDYVKRIFELQNEEFKKILDDINSSTYGYDLDENILKRNELLSRLTSVKNEYERIGSLLSKSNDKNKFNDAQIIFKFLSGRQNMAANKGFNRIAGYNDVINSLKEKFSVDIVLANRLSTAKSNNNVPDVIFFYGPTGTGKTTFAKALAEDSQSNIIDLSLIDANCDYERIELIKNALELSLIHFKNTQSDGGQRTIILINEADSLIKKANPNFPNYKQQKEIIDKFIELINESAKKYKATFFITTNNPLRVDDRILDDKITPFKIGLGPCKKEEAKLILDKQLKYYNISLNTDKIVEKLFENPQKIYSNSNLVTLIENAVKNDECNEECILYAIESGKVVPSIQPRDIKIFNDALKYFNEQNK